MVSLKSNDVDSEGSAGQQKVLGREDRRRGVYISVMMRASQGAGSKRG